MTHLFAAFILAIAVHAAVGLVNPTPPADPMTAKLFNLKADACKSGWPPMGVFAPAKMMDGHDWFVVLAPGYNASIGCTTWNFSPQSGNFDHITLVRLYTYQDGHKSPNGDKLTKRYFHNAEYDYDVSNVRLTVIDTDYVTWAVVETCEGGNHFPLILSRRPLLPANYLQLEGKLHALGYDITQLRQQDTTRC